MFITWFVPVTADNRFAVCRMTLLLGPPGAGKSTLLLALAGKLDKSLRVSRRMTDLFFNFFLGLLRLYKLVMK